MIELEHILDEPAELKKYREQYPNDSWDDDKFKPIKQIIRHQLNLEQQEICVYCEDYLDKDQGHIEHIKSKTLNQPLKFVYQNLAHSCNSTEHCGHKKQRKVLPIEPRLGCNENFFLQSIDGRLNASNGLLPEKSADAEKTIDILQLNVPALAWKRKGYISTILALELHDALELLQTSPFRFILSTLIQ